jgi:serine/threonine-protein kinase
MRFLVRFRERGVAETSSGARGVADALRDQRLGGGEGAGAEEDVPTAKDGCRRGARSAWRPGSLIADRYRIEGLLGMGACAEVWRAEHILLESPAAVKLLSLARQHKKRELEGRFLREARATVQLRSPHIVQVFDFGVQADCAFMAMELLEGESLRQRLNRGRRLSPAQTARIVSQLAAGLQVAHDEGIVHRDLKPSNIFLARNGAAEVVKIVDFGIAKRTRFEGVDQLSTQKGVLIGTPSYASPEQILEASEVDAQSDLWQVAVVAFECLCGRRPFHAASIGQLMMAIVSQTPPAPSTMATVPAGFDEWFERATAMDPTERFGSATELAEELCKVLTPGISSARWVDERPSYVEPPARGAPGCDELSTVPLDGSAMGFGRDGAAATATFDMPDLRPRGRRTAVLLALVAFAVALIGLVGVLPSAPSPELDSAEPAAFAVAAETPPDVGEAAPRGDRVVDVAGIPAALSTPPSPSVAADVRPLPSSPMRLRRPPPRPRPESPSRRAEDALGI